MPGSIASGERAAGDHVVEVGVVRELTAPGVQDPEEAGEVPADVPFIAGECLDGR